MILQHYQSEFEDEQSFTLGDLHYIKKYY